MHSEPTELESPNAVPRRAKPGTRCDVHVFSMHLAGERLWTVVVRGRDDITRFDRTERSLKQAVRDALTEAERRGMTLGPASRADQNPA